MSIYRSASYLKPINKLASKGVSRTYIPSVPKYDIPTPGSSCNTSLNDFEAKRRSFSQKFKELRLTPRSPLVELGRRFALSKNKVPSLSVGRLRDSNGVISDNSIFTIYVRKGKNKYLLFNTWARQFGFYAVDSQGDYETISFCVSRLRFALFVVPHLYPDNAISKSSSGAIRKVHLSPR